VCVRVPDRPGGVNDDRSLGVHRLFGFRRKRGLDRTGFTLYGHAVAAARNPVFYTDFAVADTLDGRFDMVCLHVALLTRRCARSQPILAQSVFDAMFDDMDSCLREAGVGDLGVPRRVKAMWEGFNGRARTYARALDDQDAAALSGALQRNIWRGLDAAVPGTELAPGVQSPCGIQSRAQCLAGWTMRQDLALAVQSDADLAAGSVHFLPPTAGSILAGEQHDHSPA